MEIKNIHIDLNDLIMEEEVSKCLNKKDYITCLKIAIDICFNPGFLEYRNFLLSTWYNSKERNFFDNLLYPFMISVFLQKIYLGELNPDKREELKSLCMDGLSGRNWAEYYYNKPFDEDIYFFDKVNKRLESLCHSHLIVQVGCSSGKDIALFAKNFPSNYYIGTDPYESVIDFCNEKHNLPNLEFMVASAKTINKSFTIISDLPILVIDNGSLQYVQAEHLNMFFNKIKFWKAEIILNNPITTGALEKYSGRTSFKGNFSYNYDYKVIAEINGIKTIEFIYEPSKKNKDISHYYYHGIGE